MRVRHTRGDPMGRRLDGPRSGQCRPGENEQATDAPLPATFNVPGAGCERVRAWQQQALQQMTSFWSGACRRRLQCRRLGPSRPALRRRRVAQRPAIRQPDAHLPGHSSFLRRHRGRRAAGRRRRRPNGASCCASSSMHMSPANFLATNPEAMQTALETGGASLVEGMRLFLRRLAKGRISMTDETAFEVGRNLATTPGRGGVRERADPADPVRAAHAEGARAAAGDRAAVHQQVLHPRPAARELVRALRGRRRGTRCSWCRGATSSAEQGQLTLGRLPRARRDRRRIDVAQDDHAAPSRSTRWASASAARCSARALAVLAAQGEDAGGER